jgi:hypothetical protein
MRPKRLAAGLGAALLLLIAGNSCGRRYTDVSAEPAYATLIGQRCVVTNGLRAHGWTADLSRKDLTQEVDVTSLPGIDGPEVTFKMPIPKGTGFVVKSVRKCWNCPFDRISYRIEVPDIPRLSGYPVFARAEVLAPDQAECLSKR